MVEEIIDELENTYDFLTIEVEYVTIRTYKIYVACKVVDFKDKEYTKAIEFNFSWDIKGTNESNFNQLKYKIDRAILKFFKKEVL